MSMWPAPGMPMCSRVATKGDLPALISVQGCATTMKKVARTKNTRMRSITVFTALRMLREGSSDSAAARVATSTPVMEKITTTTPVNSDATPWGRKPPCSVRLPKLAVEPGQSLKA
ncbi:hypothetical protein D9M68_602220 [compost metagenome]